MRSTYWHKAYEHLLKMYQESLKNNRKFVAELSEKEKEIKRLHQRIKEMGE